MGKLKITLVKSVIGSTERQKKTVESLGLGKINSSVTQVDTPDIRGKVKKVEHLVSVEEIEA
ncbi:50S ribosomal protein L30 [Desulfitibacter alkalitolerans]|uniref:50S ribosomal protein L30 n=1 Tax=Desulfitibacter alkalitolerans TaxID=264641 RepID=UPI000484FAC4|nr:50S ribosomal protein L30 [Desulfitibacter alkalitolerans]